MILAKDIENIKFIKLLYKYNNEKIIDLINSCEIYKNLDNLILLDNFICELYDDLIPFCSIWELETIVEIFFKKNNYEYKISYCNTFDKIFSITIFSDKLDKYENFLKTKDLELFKKIIGKYSNIKLSDKLIPIEPSLNLVISNNNFNLSNVILLKIVDELCTTCTIKHKLLDNITQDKLEFLLSRVEKKNIFLKKILFSNNYPNVINTKMIVSTQIDFSTLKTKTLLFLLSKLLVQNNIFTDFNTILEIAYSRSAISFIEMISILKPELLDINLLMLKKIIYYGRFEIFKKIFWEIPWKIHEVLREHNPFDLMGCEINYIDDIYNGVDWRNNERYKNIIGTKKHKELFEMILSICSEKNYSHVVLTKQIKSQMMELALKYATQTNSLKSIYFANYDELKEIFKCEFELDFKSKESIAQHIKLFGKLATWNLIKAKCDENFLDFII